MGRRFQVSVYTRGVDAPLRGLGPLPIDTTDTPEADAPDAIPRRVRLVRPGEGEG